MEIERTATAGVAAEAMMGALRPPSRTGWVEDWSNAQRRSSSRQRWGQRLTQFYAKIAEHNRCRESCMNKTAITVTGLTMAGYLRAFTGVVQSVETDQRAFPDYPLRVTMPDATITHFGRLN